MMRPTSSSGSVSIPCAGCLMIAHVHGTLAVWAGPLPNDNLTLSFANRGA